MSLINFKFHHSFRIAKCDYELTLSVNSAEKLLIKLIIVFYVVIAEILHRFITCDK